MFPEGDRKSFIARTTINIGGFIEGDQIGETTASGTAGVSF